MKIKTVAHGSPDEFDNLVNAWLAEGYRLLERRLVQTLAGSADYCYAELVMPDEAPAPTQLSLAEMLQQISTTCKTTPTCDEACPLHGWCTHPQNGVGVEPGEWQGIEEVTG